MAAPKRNASRAMVSQQEVVALRPAVIHPEPLLSICIPAYNRARYLRPLLDSVFSQNYKSFNVVICEDASKERDRIRTIVQDYKDRYPGRLLYHENPTNIGYDANVRHLIETATGQFCFFMGNDDLMCPEALSTVANILHRHDDAGVVLKSYAWFEGTPANISQKVCYFGGERVLEKGREAIRVCFRRSGVLSGYIVRRQSALAAATEAFDGSLFYQGYLSAIVLRSECAVFTPKILVLARNGEPPEFGNSKVECEKYIPGSYTAQSRLNMISGAVSIIKYLSDTSDCDLADELMEDYASYFYPYIRDQLDLPAKEFVKLYRGYARLGFGRYPMFHFYCIAGYILGTRRCDAITKFIRGYLGRSPHFASMRLSRATSL